VLAAPTVVTKSVNQAEHQSDIHGAAPSTGNSGSVLISAYDSGPYGPTLGSVPPAPNWTVVPGQRRTRDQSRDWSCDGNGVKPNLLTCENALLWGLVARTRALGLYPEPSLAYPHQATEHPSPST
jgi:hypothetical protein